MEIESIFAVWTLFQMRC